MKQKIEEAAGNRWIFLIFFLLTLALLSYAFAWLFSIGDFEGQSLGGNVALIPLKGVIASDGSVSYFGESTVSSAEIISYIAQADKNPSIKAILIEINSPGGSPVASKEIADAVSRTNKTAYALIKDMGLSGGYWIASACDKIIANDMSLVGSIGVISSYLDYSGLLKDYNVTYQRLVAGKYKDIGAPYKNLEGDEKKLLQEQLDYIHDYFIKAVAKNRNLPELEIRKIATGMYYLGIKGKDIGLVDVLGDIETAKKAITQDLNLTDVEFTTYQKKRSFFDVFSSVMSEQSFFVGRGIGSQLAQEAAYSKIDIRT